MRKEKSFHEIKFHESDSNPLARHRTTPACVDRPKFRQKTAKIDSRVLNTRTYESITPPYPSTGNVRWRQKTDPSS